MSQKKEAPAALARPEAQVLTLDARIFAEILGLIKNKRVISGITGRDCCLFALNLAIGGMIGALLAGWPA